MAARGSVSKPASMRWPILLVALTCLAAGPAPPTVELAAAKRLLPTTVTCEDVPCLIEHAYQADAKAGQIASRLFKTTGDVAGVGPEEVMDGGFRGTIKLVPQLPINGYRRHLRWVESGALAIDRFFDGLFAGRPMPNYRWRALELRFVRSLVKHRPSAYAFDWTIEYNVEGSLNISEKAVRETLISRALPPERRSARRLVSATSRQRLSEHPREMRRAADARVPRALRAERYAGARRHLLRFPAEQRYRRARVCRGARCTLLQGTE